MSRQFLRASHSFSQLQGILSKMKVANEHKFPKAITDLGTSDQFQYATNKHQDRKDLESNTLKLWSKLSNYEIENTASRVPMNGFEEMIQLTEQGKLWRYPIDNEYGMDAEKNIPFEEHVFLEKHLEDFPKEESIRTFMSFIVAGLARNPWMTVDRKKEAIKFYKDYFESKRALYSQSGYDLQ